MNNLPAMTEAQRQELIERLIHFRKGIQAARDANMQTEADDKDDLIAQIALAALTAEPAGWMVKYGGIDKDFFVDKQAADRLYHDVTENGFLDVAMLQLYTAPPAPVLRVPDGWIKCSERYPEVGQEVLIRIPVCEKFNIENGKYEGDGRFLGAWFDTRGKGRPYKVTHWMPLPPEASNEQ